MHKKDSPKEIKDVVSGILSSLTGEKNGQKSKRILFKEEIEKIWEEAAGKRASMYSKPASLRNGLMIVLVNNSAWLYEMTFRKNEIIKNLKSKLGDDKLDDIRFKIGEV